MSKRIKYVQSTLRRSIENGSVRTTSYIPKKFATVGSVLKLKDENDSWVDGWVVESVGTEVLDAADVPDFRKAIRNHRKATGDSLPRQSG